jgi:NADPH-dependent glutamate synthase beta subunit-like oxidoreductase
MSKLRLAIVGAGPAGIYAADLLIKSELRDFDVSIDLFDLLPAPYGLVRYGVAPDHPESKESSKPFTKSWTAEIFAFSETSPTAKT